MPSLSRSEMTKLAGLIDASSAQFAEIHDPIAQAHGGFQWMVLNLDRSRARFLNALEQAGSGGWLPELVAKLLEAGALPELEKTSAPIKRFKTTLQKLLKPEDGFHDSADFSMGFAKARRRVCRIIVEPPGSDALCGTGFLIAPQAVLTNWHVVEALTANQQMSGGSHVHCYVEFDVSGVAGPERVDLAEDWLISHSPHNDAEDPLGQAIDAEDEMLASFSDTLDFAVIRLARPVGRERGHYQLDPRFRARLKAPGCQVTLYQHPGGGRLKHSTGAARALWPPAIETRLHHTANALPGSSGGLLLDAKFDPVGLHQSWIAFKGQPAINCAIPTCQIVDRLRNYADVTGSDPAIASKSGVALIGRDDLQLDILALAAGTQRVLSLPDDLYPEIISDMMAALLDTSDHQIASFHATHMPDNPRSFALDLVGLTVAQGADAGPSLPDADERKTAGAAWVKDVLLPPLLETLRSQLGGKTLWLVISGMATTELFGRPRGILLEQLLGRIAGLPFLRIVLVGYGGSLPSLGIEYVRTRRYRPITEQDCLTFARRFVVAEGLEVDDAAVMGAVTAAFTLASDPKEPQLAPNLARALRAIVVPGGGR